MFSFEQLYGQNPYGEFVHPTTQPPQLQYLTGQFDPSAEAAQRGAVQGRYDNTPGNAQFYDAPYNSALTPQAKLLATILAITVLHLEL
ncbi:hypothetical protein GCK32_015604 [Trichostrongylus colubriformis]|uniref:Uncharacterized protein n=1 Tax=Trichostrongylus colubriformis TaxID=6319 RepID=A0AAN8FSI2_TRICO